MAAAIVETGNKAKTTVERIHDLFLRIFCGGDRADLFRDLAESRQRAKSFARAQRETYRSGKQAILRLREELRRRDQAVAIFEKRTIELERMLAEANERSLTDPLTGLLNRRGAVDRLIGEASAVWRSAASTERPINKRLPCSIVYIDLDNFKPVNDRFGHARGDEALRAVAELLRRSFPRGGDIVARVGGDEFIVIMMNANHQIAENRSGDFLQGMKNPEAFIFDDVRMGASIGIASMILSSPTSSSGALNPERVVALLDATIKEADTAMLLSKREGKGRVTIGGR
jgi:diguanylate cyclase (GGDEF)-like protein